MYVFNYNVNDPATFTYYKVEDGEDYKRDIVQNDEYTFILVDEIPEFDVFRGEYPVVDKITSTNENGHKIGTLKLAQRVQTEEQRKNEIRYNREQKCFPVINRGRLWYNKLTDEQLQELDEWYEAWLVAPDTMIEPDDLAWVNANMGD